MKRMTSNLRKKCIKVLYRYTDIFLTDKQFEELMIDNPDLNDQLVFYDSPSDTADREWMMDAIAKKIVGRSWPCYGDGAEIAKKFNDDLDRMAREKGYRVIKNVE